MIPKKFTPYVITDIGTFNTTKFAADESNTTYFLGSDQDTVLQGAPDVLYNYFCTINPLGIYYTHGRFNMQSINSDEDGLIRVSDVKNAINTAPRFYLGTCSTAGNVAIKQVDIPNFPTQLVNGVETPIVGSVIAVKFVNDDSYHINSEPGKIKVNNTSAYPVWYNTEENQSQISGSCYGVANRYGYYIFNGTHWVWVNHGVDNNTTYTPPSLGFGYASCVTAAATAAKTASLSNYKLVNNGLVVVYFQYDVPAQATLNINSGEAKEIHFQGSRIAAGVIKAGDKCLFIYNGNYMLIAIDRWGKELQEKVSGINISETDFEALSTYEQGKLYFVYDDNNNS